MTLFRLALRLGRVGAIAAGVIGTAAGIAQPLAFAQLAGNTAQDRALFAQQMEILGRQLLYILPVPGDLGTMAGYIEWRALGTMPLILGFWAVIAASGAGRGDEERGLVEHWLAQGISRGRYLASRIAAFALLGTAVVAVVVGGTGLGAVIASDPVPVGGLALQGVAMLGLLLCCYAVALVAAQLATTRRGAIGLGGAVVLALYLIDVAGRTGGAEAIRWISPFWRYDQNHPLLRGGSLDVPGTLALYLAAILLTGGAAAAFVRRDIGGSLLRRRPRGGTPTTRPSRDPLLRLPVLAILDQQRSSILVWSAAFATLAVFFLSTTRTIVDTMLATPSFRFYLERAGLTSYTSFIGVIWFSTLVLLVSMYAIAQTNGWAADDDEGRLEIVAAQPVSRSRIVLERLAALVAGAAIVVFASSVAVVIAASAADIPVDTGRLALGTALTLGVVFAFGGLGAAGVAWRPRTTVVVLGAVAVASYFLQELAPLFGWPAWVEDLSLYALYGQPLSGTVDWARTTVLLGIGAVGSVVALAAMRRRDIGR